MISEELATSPALKRTKSDGLIDAFVLKVIAILGMTADHIGIAFSAYLPDWARIVLYAPGGLTFPIMAYLLVVGYTHTHDVKKYALRLFAFALLAQIPFSFFIKNELNVLFTLLLGLLVLYLNDRLQNRLCFWGIAIAVAALTAFCDWAYVGIPIILCYRMVESPFKSVCFPAIIVWSSALFQLYSVSIEGYSIIRYALPTLAYGLIGTTLTIPLLLNYNGRRGFPLKYFFYAYYPLHLAAILLIRYVVFG
jgi:hypothetical protein